MLLLPAVACTAGVPIGMLMPTLTLVMVCLIPDQRAMAQVPARRLRPYVGVGIGTLFGARGGSGATVSASAGVRAAAGRDRRLSARAETRVRVRPGFGGAYGGVEVVAGIGYSF